MMPASNTSPAPYTSARNISRARTRWATPRSISAHSSAAMTRGTRSSGNGRSSPDRLNVMPWSRKERSRVAQRSANSSFVSSRSVSCSAAYGARGLVARARTSRRRPDRARSPRRDQPLRLPFCHRRAPLADCARHVIRIRNATFRDARRSTRSSRASRRCAAISTPGSIRPTSTLALVEGDDVTGFAARKRHKEHPQRDFASFWVRDGSAHDAADLFRAVTPRKPRPLKLRLPADDEVNLDIAGKLAFRENIRSATYMLGADAFDADRHAVEDVDPNRKDLAPMPSTRSTRTRIAGIRPRPSAGATSARPCSTAPKRPPSCSTATRSSASAWPTLRPTRHSRPTSRWSARSIPPAPTPTRSPATPVAALAAFYVDDARPIWFEVDPGQGTNEPLARLIDAEGPSAVEGS